MTKILISPFQEYCDQIDSQAILSGMGMEFYYSLIFKMQNENPEYLLKALKNDFIYRAAYGLNVIASIEGQQGTFKSLFGLWMGLFLGQIFNKPFDIEHNLYVIPEDLDSGIRESDYRTTHILDEQRNKNVGLGSRASMFSLQDFEEQCRWTQKNIIYISPNIVEHSHYFVFVSQDKIERYHNELYCDNCPIENQKECFKHKWETNCPGEFVLLRGGEPVPFHQRTGYPVQATFLLKTKRKMDGWEVPRGFITIPMVSPEIARQYDLIKAINVQKLESQTEGSNYYLTQAAEEFFNGNKERLYKLTGSIFKRVYKLKDEEGNPFLKEIEFDSRRFIPLPKSLMESYFYDYIASRRKFTQKEVNIIVAITKEKVSQYCTEKFREMQTKGLNSEKTL